MEISKFTLDYLEELKRFHDDEPYNTSKSAMTTAVINMQRGGGSG